VVADPDPRLITVILYTGMGLPPVVVGLAVYLLLSRSGPLGESGLAFHPARDGVGPDHHRAARGGGPDDDRRAGVDPALRLQVRALGATRWQELAAVLREARIGVMAAIVAAFGSIISEVGAVMLVGGNIEGQTRVLTTAIVLNTRMGEFDLALALGIILLR
jgi:tungstate transport system permease protein